MRSNSKKKAIFNLHTYYNVYMLALSNRDIDLSFIAYTNFPNLIFWVSTIFRNKC